MLAVGGKTEMTRLDDAGMHRPDRDLVQAFTFDGEELIRRGLLRRPVAAERLRHGPEAEIEPGPRIGRAHRVKPEQIADGAFQPQCRRMLGADARIFSVLTNVSQNGDGPVSFVQQRHMHLRRIAPQPEQRRVAVSQALDGPAPAFLGLDGACRVHAAHPNSLATFSKPATSAGGM